MSARRPPDPSQLALFAPGDPLSGIHRELAEIAMRISPLVHFGTSSWAFPGWRGLVYPHPAPTTDLARDGLRDYVRFPLFGTVGIDRGYYAPIPAPDLERYATQLPPGFRCCTKAPAQITARVFAGHGRGIAGEINPDFLSHERFIADVLDPFRQHFASHIGPFILEFPPVSPPARLAPREFVRRLDAFLTALPRDLPYAVEIRDRAYLTTGYRDVLGRHGVAHVYNYWSAMPLPEVQRAIVPPDTASFTVVRLLLRPGARYDERKAAFAPFDQLVEPDEVMRGQVIDHIQRAIDAGRDVYVLVNNKAEGSAPLTIRALAERLARGE